ncbi:hypothetical protein baBA2_000928 (plasmid) [Borrelia anserina]|uniref:Lipoprotein n=1 Tax=Borrelia anserina Es TaxID=1365188 RepID=A0ABN4UBA8_BORAN|nr:hypothetical protein [Borrelia anserina]APR65334.1 hypothetical protein N187_A15 [Borrelia anserina Es]UPA07302.1 hypothetical protein baBA2_000928 [Borrelia anserina]
MKRYNLIMSVMSCNLGEIVKDRQVGKEYEDEFCSKDKEYNPSMQQAFDISAKDRAYYALKMRLLAYREELEEAHNSFNLGGLLFNIPFKKISQDFTTLDKQDKIYAGLGYDSEVIEQLGRVFGKLDLNNSYFINTDAAIANGLLVILNHISDYTTTLVNYYLNGEKLVKIKVNKDEVRINEIYFYLEEFINLRKVCISNIKSHIALLESRITREAVLSGMKEITNNEGEIGQEISLMGKIAVTIWSLS